jgi:hypothetical protein
MVLAFAEHPGGCFASLRLGAFAGDLHLFAIYREVPAKTRRCKENRSSADTWG